MVGNWRFRYANEIGRALHDSIQCAIHGAHQGPFESPRFESSRCATFGRCGSQVVELYYGICAGPHASCE
jgi:hypothetical protein